MKFKGLVSGIIGFLTTTESYLSIQSNLDFLSPFERIMARITLQINQNIIVPTKFTEKQVKAMCKRKTHVIPNGIDFKSYVFTKNELTSSKKWLIEKYGESKLNILFVGRLVRRKGVMNFPKIMNGLDDMKLFVVGTGELENLLIKKTENAENIKMIGFIPDDTLRRYYLACDVCLFPSIIEPFGIVVLEAMIFGKPVIASDVYGISDILKGGYGILVKSNDLEGFKKALIEMKDSKIRKKYGDRSLERIADFGWNEISKKTIKIFEETRFKKKWFY